MTRNVILILLASLASAAAALAQYGTYATPGSLGEERVPTGDAIRQQALGARWQLGPIELEPQLSIGNLSYVSNVYSTRESEAESDLRASAAAGLRGFLNLGPKVLVSPFTSLSYSWWQNQTNLRSLHESLGLQVLGDFNRLQLQLQAGRVETQRNLSSELEVPVDLRTDRLELAFEIDFWGPFSLFGAVARGESRHFGRATEQRVPGLDLGALDVDTENVNGGIGYRFPNGLKVAVGVERTEATFPDDPGGRSSQGSARLLRVGIAGPRLSIDFDAAQRDLEFVSRQGGQERRQLTGLGQFGWKLTETLSTRLYGALQLQPSAVDVAALFEGRRSGINLLREPGPRTRISIFYEVGDDEFVDASSDRLIRVDEVTSYGLNYHLQLTDRLTLNLGLVDSRRDSSNPAFDRSLTAVTTRINLGGNLLPW